MGVGFEEVRVVGRRWWWKGEAVAMEALPAAEASYCSATLELRQAQAQALKQRRMQPYVSLNTSQCGIRPK